MTNLYVLLAALKLRSMHTSGISKTFPLIIHILSRFLGALRMMLSTRNSSCEKGQSHHHRFNIEHRLTSAASLAEDTTARFSL